MSGLSSASDKGFGELGAYEQRSDQSRCLGERDGIDIL